MGLPVRSPGIPRRLQTEWAIQGAGRWGLEARGVATELLTVASSSATALSPTWGAGLSV